MVNCRAPLPVPGGASTTTLLCSGKYFCPRWGGGGGTWDILVFIRFLPRKQRGRSLCYCAPNASKAPSYLKNPVKFNLIIPLMSEGPVETKLVVTDTFQRQRKSNLHFLVASPARKCRHFFSFVKVCT